MKIVPKAMYGKKKDRFYLLIGAFEIDLKKVIKVVKIRTGGEEGHRETIEFLKTFPHSEIYKRNHGKTFFIKEQLFDNLRTFSSWTRRNIIKKATKRSPQ